MEPLGTCPHRFFFPSVAPSNNCCLETEAAKHDCMLSDAACKTETNILMVCRLQKAHVVASSSSSVHFYGHKTHNHTEQALLSVELFTDLQDHSVVICVSIFHMCNVCWKGYLTLTGGAHHAWCAKTIGCTSERSFCLYLSGAMHVEKCCQHFVTWAMIMQMHCSSMLMLTSAQRQLKMFATHPHFDSTVMVTRWMSSMELALNGSETESGFTHSSPPAVT